MKKFLVACGAAALVLSIASCDSKKKSSDELTAMGDSIAVMSGEVNGMDWLSRYSSIPEADRSKFSKSGIVKGIETVLMADTADQGYLVGLINIGPQMLQSIAYLEQQGISIDRKAFVDEFKKAFNGDSVDAQKLMNLQAEVGQLTRRALQMAEKKREEAAASTPEALANIEAGKKYVEAAKAEDPAIVTTPSGLNYKVVKEGEGEAVGTRGRAVVNYKGKLVDGTTFDSGDEARFSPNSVIPGFAEGLAMMKKGGVYQLIIPAELAYGAKTTGSIPVMSTLIFDVEVVDVELPE